MLRRAVLLIFLLSIGIEFVLGQDATEIKNKLVTIQDSMTEVVTRCLRISTVPIDPTKPNANYPEIKSAIHGAIARISELPPQAGNIVDTIDRRVLRNTHVAIAKASNHLMYAVNALIKQNQVMAYDAARNLLNLLYEMVAKVTAPLQRIFNGWTGLLLAAPALHDTRRSLLYSLDSIVPVMCQLKFLDVSGVNGNQIISRAGTILYQINIDVSQITIVSCNGLLTCIDDLVPIANRIQTKTDCTIYNS